jgi:hypothetical protein
MRGLILAPSPSFEPEWERKKADSRPETRVSAGFYTALHFIHVALHKIDMILVLSVGCPTKGIPTA